MSKFMSMIRWRVLLLLLFHVLWFQFLLRAGSTGINQSIPIKAFGTGFTTGNVADLVVKNKSKSDLHILPQRVFIPSTGQYQPYIADIPQTTIPAGSMDTIHLQGYCTDVNLAAAPPRFELIPLIKWIPIRIPDSTLVGDGIYLITHNSAVPFTKDHISYIITSSAYSPLYPPPDTLHIVTWPGTDIPAGGSMNHVGRPDLYASIMAKVLELLEVGVDQFQEEKHYATPYSVSKEKEREAIIQQLIWMYATSLAGKKYGKEEFRSKVYEEFKTRTALTEISDLEKQELDEGIDEFWNVFLQIAKQEKLFIVKEEISSLGTLVDLPIDTITYPWSKVSMTDIIMKPGYTSVIPVKVSNPALPIIAAGVSIGSLLFIAFNDHTSDTDCVFTVMLVSNPASCQQENGFITLTTSVDAEYEYLWSNGATTKNLVGVPPGNYSVTVTRINTNCAQSAEAVVENAGANFNTNIISTDAHCGNADGTATVNVDPAGFYTYLWSNGSTEKDQTNLAAGDYSLTVTASGTCADTSAITINDLPANFTISITSTPDQCGASDGSLSATVDPPGEYQYAWSNGSTTNAISGLPTGTYSVTVTDNTTGCTATEEATVESSSPSITISINSTDATCGSSDGTANTIVDPPGEYDYGWSNGQTTSSISGLSPGTYTVYVSIPGTECKDSSEIAIGELPPNYTINTTTTPASCGLIDGTASATVDPPGAYEFRWSNGQTGAQVTGLAPGNYTVTVSLPGNICVQTADVTVSQLPPSFSLTPSSTPASCGLSDGTATVIVDPPGEYNYLWTGGQTTMQITELSAGTYDVTVSIPGTNCVQGLSITVGQLPPSFTINVSSTLAHCGLSDGTATVTVDPPAEYNYIWSNGQTTASITGLAPGSYSVTVSIPGTSCQQVSAVNVDQEPASFTVGTSSTPAHCGVNDGTATATVNPPGEYMYQWSGGQSGPTISELLAGQYIVSVSLVGSTCFVTDTVVVDQLPLSLNASFTTTNADCGVSNGSATVTIDPAGNYTYTWSNQQSGNNLQQVPTGNYDVTVTDANSCTAVFSTSIGENAAHYLDINSTSPATCIGGGEISFTLSSAGSGQFSVEISTPGGQVPLILSSGSYQLSAFTNVLPGSYSFTVYDQGIGPVCSETQSTQVSDQTPALSTTDDVYTTPNEQAISGNVLQNDSGLDLQLTAVNNIVGGNVTFSANGNFTYTPNQGFSGAGSFIYTVTDACGNTATGTAIINVQMVACNITISSILAPANCDLSNGSIAVSVNQPGSYQYLWNTGQTTSTINNVPSGSYSVTITQIGTGCVEDFNINLTEYPANYITNIVITQPTCTSPGEIQFTLNTQGSAQFIAVSVDHPNGTQTFTIEPGVVVLSDYIEIVEGSYHIEAFIGDAGPACIDDFNANIIAAPAVVIEAGQITPPSSQGAADGMVDMTITDPGVAPYSIFVNGGFYGTTSSLNFQVTGLMTGFYDIQVVDVTGCASNIEMVIIPLPIMPFSLGITVINATANSVDDHLVNNASPTWHTGISSSWQYRFGKKTHQLRVIYSPEFADAHFKYASWIQLEHLSEIISLYQKRCSFSLEGGLGYQSLFAFVNGNNFYLSLNGVAQMKFGRLLRLQAEISLHATQKEVLPQTMIIASIPFGK